MIELTIDKQQLLPPLLVVAGAVDKKQTLPVLSNVLLRLQDNQLLLTGTDLEIEVTASVPCEQTNENIAVTVQAKKMVDIIRSLDDKSKPTITLSEDTVYIKEGRSRFRLTTLPADDFPCAQGEVNEAEISLPREALTRLFQATHFALSQQDVRFFLNSLLFEIDTTQITAVAMDGHRMAICRLPFEMPGQLYQRVLIPRKGIQELLRLLNNVSDEKVSFYVGKNHVTLCTNQYTFSSKLVEARFPAYEKAIPRGQDKHVSVEASTLKRALSRIVILANEASKAVVLHLEDNQITLMANNQSKEEALEVLEAKTEGGELKIALNADYLLSMLNNISTPIVNLSFSSMESSILVEPQDDAHYQYIIMPMKL